MNTDISAELETFHGLLKFANEVSGIRPAPTLIADNLPQGHRVVDEVAEIIGEGTHGPYFAVSKNRYAHYFAAGMATLSPGSLVLDVGNAPGHVGIGFNQMGHTVRGLNLNAEWRSTYPNQRWLDTFQVVEHDLENAPIPFADNTFDAVLFTEILEHIAITNPRAIVEEILRVLKPGGVLIFSTPNVCNISNIYALLKGVNVFWQPEIFYGSTDRHNREYTPSEANSLMVAAGFEQVALWGLNDYSNWRTGAAEFAVTFVGRFGEDHSLCLNTTAAIYKKPY